MWVCAINNNYPDDKNEVVCVDLIINGELLRKVETANQIRDNGRNSDHPRSNRIGKDLLGLRDDVADNGPARPLEDVYEDLRDHHCEDDEGDLDWLFGVWKCITKCIN
jgi:hypothetical protein